MLAGVYRTLMKVARWWGRLVTSAVAGLMAALVLCLGRGALAGLSNRDRVTVVLMILAVPLCIFVSVMSYRFLRQGPGDH